MYRKLLALGILSIVASSAFAQYRHVSIQNKTRALPQKVIVLPADVLVQELSAGGMLEKVPDWTKQSSENLTKALIEIGKTSDKFTVLDVPALAEEEQEKLDQAIGAFMTVGVTAHNMLQFGGSAWEHKRKEFDYTLGSGLAFLKEKTGADAAILVAGDDVVSSGGRKAAVVFAAVLGIGLPTGRSIAVTSMVDLETGNLLWMHYDQSMSKDLKDYPSAKEMVTTILGGYPGKE
jgi:hypothetical protein